MPFRYKKVLIIGATSGIGHALALKFVSEGSSVIAVGRRASNLSSLKETSPSQISTAVLDITSFSSLPSFASSTLEAHPDLDCIIFNSGLQRHLDWTNPSTVDLSLADTEFTTNYTAYLHLTKAFLPLLQANAPKEIALVYVTSGLALVPISSCPNYCASKAALHHMVLALRMQMKSSGSNVKIVELMPPAVQTELHDDKHQPQFKGTGRNIGMPLDEFTEEAYQGLNEGVDQVAVGMAKTVFGAGTWEPERQKSMWQLHEHMKAQKA